ncbi:hypothetical protein WBU96_06780 [Bacillus albus]|uniref:hypothetical protein n=1 Tax=Bacillus cereus group TaxID=86661 RepID=UPI0022E3330F|nr:hypothetical protein [Bacillus cereus group sp. Bc177]MDA2320300.1 hypothetical protein [Bacillus cereus group sp. Bc177]
MRPDRVRRCCNKKTSKCACSGTVKNFISPSSRIDIDICEKCENKDGNVFIQITNNIIFRSTFVGLPLCETREDGLVKVLLVTGEGLLFLNGVLYEGMFSLFLAETSGAFDNVNFIFYDLSRPTDPIRAAANLANIPDANFSIKNCYSDSCSCKSKSSISFKDSSEFDDNATSKITIFHPDGNVEEIKL